MRYNREKETACRIKDGKILVDSVYATLDLDQVLAISRHVRAVLNLTDRPRRRDYCTDSHLVKLALSHLGAGLIPTNSRLAVAASFDAVEHTKKSPAGAVNTDRASWPSFSQGGQQGK